MLALMGVSSYNSELADKARVAWANVRQADIELERFEADNCACLRDL